MAQSSLHVIYDSGFGERPHMAELDVVAVPGPNFGNGYDHARKTWMMGDKLWLKDFLPNALAKPTRVMLFECNSSPAIDATAIKMAGHANNLLQWLAVMRKDDPQRPLVFLCHSLGGLIIKEAFVTVTSDATYKSIFKAACLLVFFATPHQDGNYASLGDILVKIVRNDISEPGYNLLDTLKKDSEKVTEHFKQCSHLPDQCLVVSFYEGDPYGKIGPIVDKKSATLDLPGLREKQIAMHADHNTICKFDSPDSPAYQLVLRAISNGVSCALAMGISVPGSMPSFPMLGYPLTPMTPARTFIQRPSLRDSIRNQFQKPMEAGRQGEVKKVGVWGMGGVGKSQLALSYLQHYRTEYDATFWIQAEQTASIDRDFLAIYRLLIETTTSTSYLNPKNVKRRVVDWFTRASGKYLVIFDGADSLHRNDEGFIELSEYCPVSPNIHILITSRSSVAKSISTFEAVSVGELEESQSVELFLKCAETQLAPECVLAEAKAIVHELGHIALAVSMAGKYVSQTPRLLSNLSAYLDELHSHQRDLLSETPSTLAARSHHGIVAVWEMSYDAVFKHVPEAGRLLTLLSFLHYDDIFLELFSLDTHPGSTALAPWVSVLGCQGGADLHCLEKYFQVLEDYSLCQRKQMKCSYSIHRLIHAWSYDRLKNNRDELEHFSYAASQLLDNCIGTVGDRQDGSESELRVVPHLTANIHGFKKASGVNDWNHFDWLEAVGRFGLFMQKMGRWDEAVLIRKEVLEKRRGILGDDDLSTISALNNLADTLSNQGNLDKAASVKKEVVEKLRWILGDDHAYTNSIMYILANLLGDQGKLDEIALMMTEIFGKLQRILGDDHPSTITALNNLADTLSDQGKLEEATLMRERVLEKRQRNLGDDHPSTISAMNNLADVLGDQGKLDETALMMTEVLKRRQRILGDDHPDIISAMNNLTVTLGDQGKLDEAVSIMTEVLKKMQWILGNDHPSTITAINNLTDILGDQGKLDKTALIREEVLKKRQRILGDNHPDTISALDNLTILLGDQGKLEETASIRKEVLEKRQRILGDHHPDTISAINNFAISLGDQGKLDEAASIITEVLKKRQRILGDDHPSTITAMNNLAILLGKQGKLDISASIRKEVLKKRQRTLGDVDPSTITVMSNLAATLGNQDIATESPDISIAKKQRFLRRVTGKLQKARESFRSGLN